MKKFLSVFVFMFALCSSFAQRVSFESDCRVIRRYASETHCFYLFGDVYVETDPKEPVDLDIKVVNGPIAAFNIYITSDKPDDCGEWRFVSDRSQAKFTIRYVKKHEDCTIRFVKDRSQAG